MKCFALQSRLLYTLLIWLLVLPALPWTSQLAADDRVEDKKERLIERIGERLQRSAVAFGTDFSKWPQHVAKRRAAIDAAQTPEEIEAALGAALAEFDMSHLRLFSPHSARSLRQGLRTGIGVSIRPVANGFFVTYVLTGSPAWRSGIRKLDTLTTIDGTPLRDIRQLYGQSGARRALAWTRDGRTYAAEVKYAAFPVADRSSMRWISEEVAVIGIQSFQYRFYNMRRVNRYFREARDAKAIIIDLRNNRGGLALYSQHLASKITPCHETFSLRVNKRRFLQASRQSGGRPPSEAALAAHAKKTRPLPFSRHYKGKVVVLVDELSASGADLFPAFVQETGRGIVIGERTGGALQLARTFRLPFGYRLYAPIAEVLTPSGNRLEKNGLKPDIELSFRDTADDAVILKLAMDAIE